jgi:hypothetical protein
VKALTIYCCGGGGTNSICTSILCAVQKVITVVHNICWCFLLNYKDLALDDYNNSITLWILSVLTPCWRHLSIKIDKIRKFVEDSRRCVCVFWLLCGII